MKIFKIDDNMKTNYPDVFSFMKELKSEISFEEIKEEFSNLSIFENESGYRPLTIISSGFIFYDGKVIPFIKLHAEDEDSCFYNYDDLKKELIKSKCFYILETKYKDSSLLNTIRAFFNKEYKTNININSIKEESIIFDLFLNKSKYEEFSYRFKERACIEIRSKNGFALTSTDLSLYNF